MIEHYDQYFITVSTVLQVSSRQFRDQRGFLALKQLGSFRSQHIVLESGKAKRLVSRLYWQNKWSDITLPKSVKTKAEKNVKKLIQKSLIRIDRNFDLHEVFSTVKYSPGQSHLVILYKKGTFHFSPNSIRTSSGDLKQVSEEFQGSWWLGGAWWV